MMMRKGHHRPVQSPHRRTRLRDARYVMTCIAAGVLILPLSVQRCTRETSKSERARRAISEVLATPVAQEDAAVKPSVNGVLRIPFREGLEEELWACGADGAAQVYAKLLPSDRAVHRKFAVFLLEGFLARQPEGDESPHLEALTSIAMTDRHDEVRFWALDALLWMSDRTRVRSTLERMSTMHPSVIPVTMALALRGGWVSQVHWLMLVRKATTCCSPRVTSEMVVSYWSTIHPSDFYGKLNLAAHLPHMARHKNLRVVVQGLCRDGLAYLDGKRNAGQNPPRDEIQLYLGYCVSAAVWFLGLKADGREGEREAGTSPVSTRRSIEALLRQIAAEGE